MSGGAEERPCTVTFDAKWVIPPRGAARDGLRCGWEAKPTERTGGGCTQLFAESTPLSMGLEGGDALSEDDRNDVVERCERATETGYGNSVHRLFDHPVSGFEHSFGVVVASQCTCVCHQPVATGTEPRDLDPATVVGDVDGAGTVGGVGGPPETIFGETGGGVEAPHGTCLQGGQQRVVGVDRNITRHSGHRSKGVGQGTVTPMSNDDGPDEAPVLRTSPVPGVVTLTMNRPQVLNAMTSQLVARLHDEFDTIAADPSIRVVVLTGAGRGFCAGLDIAGYGTPPGHHRGGRPQASLAVQRHIASLITHMRSLPQPVIAAVNGPAAGGGLALVLGADVRLASPTARFSAAFIKIGLSGCDIGTSWLLPRLVGAARAQELMLTGRVFDADEALRIGLVVDVVDDVLSASLAKAQLIMANAPFGVSLTKEGMWAAMEIPALATAIEYENRQQIMATFTEDHHEAMAAFMQRRPPRYHDR